MQLSRNMNLFYHCKTEWIVLLSMAMKKNVSLPFSHQSKRWRFRARCVRVSGCGGAGGCGRGHELDGCGGGELQPKKKQHSKCYIYKSKQRIFYFIFQYLQYFRIIREV